MMVFEVVIALRLVVLRANGTICDSRWKSPAARPPPGGFPQAPTASTAEKVSWQHLTKLSGSGEVIWSRTLQPYDGHFVPAGEGFLFVGYHPLIRLNELGESLWSRSLTLNASLARPRELSLDRLDARGRLDPRRAVLLARAV